jgi:hypothetical protein
MKDSLSKEATSMVACAKSLYAKGGINMFTRGLPTTVLRAFPVNAVSKHCLYVCFVYKAILAFIILLYLNL